VKSYLGLLVQGKNDFDAIEEFRGDDFFTARWTLQGASVLDFAPAHGHHAPSWFELAGEFNLSLLSANHAMASWTLVPGPAATWLWTGIRL
jgi:hypothetical protein